ncbi:hypothetical protein KC337_g12 [Hortaea werneckii]|nr:hypothetical protein KC337_g12 [Hortaea werneckii]
MLAPQTHSLLIYPLLGLDTFLLHIIRRRDAMTLQSLHSRVIAGPDEINNAASRILALLARRGDDPVSTRAKHTVRVLDCCPFAGNVWFERARLARGFGPYLQTSEPVHQDCDGAEIGMKLYVVDVIGRTYDHLPFLRFDVSV